MMHVELQGFSKPSLLNSTSKNTHLVFTFCREATSVNAIILTNVIVILTILHYFIFMTNLLNDMHTLCLHYCQSFLTSAIRINFCTSW